MDWLSLETALFTFTVSSDDGSRVLINNEVVLDHINLAVMIVLLLIIK